MNVEQQLLDLILSSPKTKKIKNMAEELEKESKFTLSNDVEKLKGIWELRWSSSKAPFLNYSPLVDNLQILDPLNLNGLNLLKPRGINSIIGTGIVAKLSSLNEKKIGVSFTHAGIIGPYIGIRKINALTKIKKEQKGWLEITFLSKNLRICRGDKGTLFILRRIKDNILFERFQEFITSL
ncbi:conserved hypothetical [Prochlorococcus marinus subsp. pastoris str. CCMP1986]|uniref:Conserved hypothetical n=1 Tax=Prochlorococcus marinus subsp. pastoris (strain CCMP1986 / NIES-2087 / MED4) TaxID=59919 RepID=Q7V167_PROMP|nr:PAP/fibrillin family protein [Prochlorococcus marinus]KGF88835.1 hypothetical protein PROCH_0119 [Prochlorococcus marinus str. EQPAC1]CAE19476.1 conserved hypothetical [Prochlorococcus marinus subsp. pastoris str. CCMP1986]